MTCFTGVVAKGLGACLASQSDLMLEQDPLLGSYPSLLPALSCPHYPFCISHSKATSSLRAGLYLKPPLVTTACSQGHTVYRGE